MLKLRLILLSLFIALVGIYFSYLLYPGYHMFGALDFSVDKSNITERAEKLAQSFGISTEDLYIDIKLKYKNDLIRKIQTEYGLSKGNEIIRRSVPGYWWDIQMTAAEPDDVKNKELSNGDTNIIDNLENLHFQYDTHGNLIHFSFTLPDTVSLTPVSYSEAKKIAYDFIQMNTELHQIRDTSLVNNNISILPGVSFDDNEKQKTFSRQIQDQSLSYDFKWVVRDEIADCDIEIKMKVSGDKISSFDRDYDVPDKFREDDIYHGTIGIILIIALVIITVIVAFRKIRSSEIRFRLAVILGITLTVINAIETYFLASRIEGNEKFLAVAISSIFLGGIFIVIWAVAESVGRETWGDKFIPLDLLIKGHIFHSKMGEGVLRGISIGVVSFLVYMVSTWLFSNLFSITVFTTDEYLQDVFGSANPVVLILSHGFWSNLYVLAVNCILVMTLIYNKLQKGQLTIILASIPLALMFGGNIQPLYVGLFIKMIAFSILLWGFYRYDILTVFLSLTTFRVLDIGISFINSSDTSMQMSTEIFSLLFGFLMIYAVYALYSKDRVTDFKEIRPALAKFISERQRMQQELKIARDVQMSFLPQHLPTVKGLDIAAKCIPALEVGGDYYDFVKMNPTKLGVAIGDVSGKGTRAAFYMTLVKGFLKALSMKANSPAVLLKELNLLFFENAKRDAFISMVYGIFDLNAKTLILARSGHNPVIMYGKKENKIDMIKTNGLALGLEKGDLFNRMMQETVLPLSKGDVVVFYTDGFTEAMDKNRAEFGEERLQETIKKYSDAPAEEILNNLFREAKKFSRGAKQNDDMSAVVVKIA